MAKKLDAYHRAQREFTQNASHELKTPLMSISGYAEGIRDEVFQGDKVKKGLDVIIQESNRLGKIVAEMTLLAKLDSEDGIFQWSSVNVKDIVSETIERIYPLLTKRGLSVRTTFTEDADQQLVIHADRDKLLQALINVVGNSVKYAKRQIQIKVSLIRNDIEISITDDGDGIPETLLPHVFHRFVRGKDGETGLGLAISRAIVERCGGVITAQNLDTGGANVMMRFPVSA
ncbi:sensor histidine kinase [Alicyclobacillus acidoterrestris]